MEYQQYKEELYSAFEQNKLSHLLSDEKAEKLYRFSNILIETNKSFNLTAITDENDIILKHFIDCASVIQYISDNSTVIDVGCGAGFPSIPLAILNSTLKITSLDSTSKKISFINSTAIELNLGNVTGVCGRAEEFVTECREQYSVGISRAVARLNILSEICIPFIKKGGLFIAMKSSRGKEEYSEAKSGISKLGCTFEGMHKKEFTYRDSSIQREIYLFKKSSSTPSQFPRKYSQILKKPL